MNKGMTRPIDHLGRIVIPMEIRKSMNIESGDRLVIAVHDGKITMEPEQDMCAICGSKSNLVASSNGYQVCGCCMVNLKRSLEA